METKLLNIAVMKLSDDLDETKTKLEQALKEIVELKKTCSHHSSEEQKPVPVEEDSLLNIKEVLSKLGICYNSLNKLIKQGLIKPIRINQRRIRFSRSSIIQYIRLNS